VLSHMAVESLTYAEIGERLGVSVRAARALVKRLRLPRMLNNDRKVIAQIDFSEIKHRPQPNRGCHEWLGLDFRLGLNSS